MHYKKSVFELLLENFISANKELDTDNVTDIKVEKIGDESECQIITENIEKEEEFSCDEEISVERFSYQS